MVQGTLGYLDPKYMQTSQLIEKSDVYSFGVVLVELLTRKKALSFDRPEGERSLAIYFISFLKDNRLFEILESIKPMRASQRWGSFRDILKLGKSVTKTVPAFRVVWTVPMTAFWYSKNLDLRSEILETTGSPFLPWKVSASCTASKWRCVHPCFCQGITNSLGRARVMKFSVSLTGILNWSNLEVWTYILL